jgi:hypothetical protein
MGHSPPAAKRQLRQSVTRLGAIASASITSTSPDGARAATFSLAPARAGAGSKSRAQVSSRDHMATSTWDRGCGDYSKGEGTSTQALGAGFPRLSATRG